MSNVKLTKAAIKRLLSGKKLVGASLRVAVESIDTWRKTASLTVKAFDGGGAEISSTVPVNIKAGDSLTAVDLERFFVVNVSNERYP